MQILTGCGVDQKHPRRAARTIIGDRKHTARQAGCLKINRPQQRHPLFHRLRIQRLAQQQPHSAAEDLRFCRGDAEIDNFGVQPGGIGPRKRARHKRPGRHIQHRDCGRHTRGVRCRGDGGRGNQQQNKRETHDSADRRTDQRNLKGGTDQPDRDILVKHLDRDQRGKQIAETIIVGDLALIPQPEQRVPKDKPVHKADIEEEQCLACALDCDVGKDRKAQQQGCGGIDHPGLDNGRGNLDGLIPLQRNQRRDQHTVKVPAVAQVHPRREQDGDHHDDVGFRAGQNGAGDIFVQKRHRADAEIGIFHQHEPHRDVTEPDHDQRLHHAAQIARLPQLVGHQRHHNQTETVQIGLQIKHTHIARIPPDSDGRQKPSVKDQAHADAGKHQRHKAVTPEKAAPAAPAGKLFRKQPDDEIGN